MSQMVRVTGAIPAFLEAEVKALGLKVSEEIRTALERRVAEEKRDRSLRPYFTTTMAWSADKTRQEVAWRCKRCEFVAASKAQILSHCEAHADADELGASA